MRVVHSLGFDVTVIAAFPSLDGPQGSPSFFDEQKICACQTDVDDIMPWREAMTIHSSALPQKKGSRSNRAFVSSQHPAAECARGLSILDRRRLGSARTGASGQDRCVGSAHERKKNPGKGGGPREGVGFACVEEFPNFPCLLRPEGFAGHKNQLIRGGSGNCRLSSCRRVRSGQVGQVRFKDSISLDAKRRTVYCLLRL